MLSFDTTRRFGAEFEVGFAADWDEDLWELCREKEESGSIPSGWAYKDDDSLDEEGMEIVTPPLSGISGLKEIFNAGFLKDSFGIDAGGFHVHHDASDLDNRTVFNIHRAYNNLVPFLNDFGLFIDRHEEGEWASTWSPKSLYNFFRKRGRCPSGKWHAVNQHPYLPTVEFRAHWSTSDPNRSIAWIVFTQLVMLKGILEKFPSKMIHTQKQVLSFLRPATELEMWSVEMIGRSSYREFPI